MLGPDRAFAGSATRVMGQTFAQVTAASHHSNSGPWNAPSFYLPKCKAKGCDNPVHYEPDVGHFDYCNPECRDRDLLEEDGKKLKRDLDKLSEELHKSQAKSIASRRSDSKKSSSQSSTTNVAASTGGSFSPTQGTYQAVGGTGAVATAKTAYSGIY